MTKEFEKKLLEAMNRQEIIMLKILSELREANLKKDMEVSPDEGKFSNL